MLILIPTTFHKKVKGKHDAALIMTLAKASMG
jgi:hypothetical protein